MLVSFSNQSDKILSTKDFVFISYSHRDRDAVFNDLAVLDSSNMNYWVDKKELLAGDKWDESVAKMLESENCKGAIMFFSPDYVISEAAEKEIELCFDKKAQGDFHIGFVSVNGKSVLSNVKLAFDRANGMDDRELERFFPQERLLTIAKYLEKNILYVPRLAECDEDGRNRFFGAFREKSPSVFDDSKYYYRVLEEKIDTRTVDGVGEIEFGLCPTSKAGDLGFYLCEGYNDVNGKQYYYYKGTAYNVEKIKWKVIDITDKETVVVSDRALCYGRPGDIASQNFSVLPLKAEGKFADAIKEITLCCEEDDEKIKTLLGEDLVRTDFADDEKKKRDKLPPVFLFGGEKTFALNGKVKRTNFAIGANNYGFIYPCIKFDTQKLLKMR